MPDDTTLRIAEEPAGQSRPPYLMIDRVTKAFGGFTALDDVSLTVHPGEFLCFLGPSGCGKTTLLRAIAGLDPQTRGTIVQNGRDVSALPPAARDFGIVFQSYALFPNLTVFRNVAYGIEKRGTPRGTVKARVEELLHLVGLPDQGHKYPSQLSGGQQQRVALARALAPSPGLLLLDEPLSALDARVRAHLRDEIRDLHRRLGVTTIMVTHDQEEALTMADRIVVMNRGRIEQVGTPLEIYRRPATRFVADFIGRMNFLPATVEQPGRVRLGAVALDLTEPDGLPAGSPVTLCIRPEDVVVRGCCEDHPNVLHAAVDRMEFTGNHFATRLKTQAADAPDLLAHLSPNAVRDLDIAPGRVIPVHLPPDRLTVFPS